MQIKLKTDELKNAVNKVVKGMGNNKILPITEMIGVNVETDKLVLVSTDGSNTVQVSFKLENNTTSESFVLNGKQFSQLVQKTTTEYVTLTSEDNKLVFKANGTYTLSFPIDEDGNLVKLLPIEIDSETQDELDIKEFNKSYEINKFSVAQTMETPSYTGFYFDENGSVTTNSIKISYVKNSLFKSPVLLNSRFVGLVSLIDSDKAIVKHTNSELVIQAGDVAIKGYKMTDVVDFPIEDIKPFLESDIPHKVRLNKKALLNVLDRISVFITPFDKNSIKIDFTEEGARVWTMDGVNNELLPYVDKENFEKSSIKVDVKNIKDLVTADPEEEITIMYGHEAAIKLSFGTVSQVLALVGD